MQDFRQLEVWQRSHEFVLDAYRVTARFPKAELYGITSQLRRAAVSVPTNLAEGCGRGTDADFARFVQIALGSTSECEYLLLLAADLDYVAPNEALQLAQTAAEIKRMLTGLLRSLGR